MPDRLIKDEIDNITYEYLRKLVIECGEIAKNNGFWDHLGQNWYDDPYQKAVCLFQKLGLVLTELGELTEAHKIYEDHKGHILEESWDIFIRLADMVSNINKIQGNAQLPDSFYSTIRDVREGFAGSFHRMEDVIATALMYISQEMEHARAYKPVNLETLLGMSISIIEYIEKCPFGQSGIKDKIEINKTRPYKHNKAF